MRRKYLLEFVTEDARHHTRIAENCIHRQSAEKTPDWPG
jgi:hypothetical protein